jgi:hypothetical protein
VAGYSQAQAIRRLAMNMDRKMSVALVMLEQGQSIASIARKLRMSEKTIGKYRKAEKLPSQMERPPRDYRTRQDPLAEYWQDVETLLDQDSGLKPVTILQWLKQKHNQDGDEPRVTDSVRRTLERRVADWKLAHGVEQEVYFPQVHRPGDLLALDFVVMNSLRVTIAGRPFEHLLFHAVLTYSNWEHVHLCHSESFEALSRGLQDALHRAGGVPHRIRSDSLTAAVNNLSSDRDFAPQYRSLLAHYGVQGHRINVRKPHENGDVESAHGHLKTALDQALLLRGQRDFGNVEEYTAFVDQVIARRNASRSVAFQEEFAALGPLPAQRLCPFTAVPVTVKNDSVLRIKGNAYSVSSKYIGLTMEVRIEQDHLELWYRNECLERMPRLFGKGREAIDFRHVIDSLVRKPGAFANYKYVHHLYPTTRFRMAYDQLTASCGESTAVKQYLKILYAAKHEGLDLVDDVLQWFLRDGKPITASEVEATVKSRQQIPGPTDVNVEPPSLEAFDSLLQHKEVYHEQETDLFEPAQFGGQAGCGLQAYDRHVETVGATQGVAVADDPGSSPGGGGTGRSRAMDADSVLVGVGQLGMSVATAEPHSPPDAEFAPAGGEDLGAVPVVSCTVACEAAVRTPPQWRVPGPAGQRADFREARLREDEPAVRVGRPVGSAGTYGVFHELPDVGSGVVAGQAGSAFGTGDQGVAQVRSLGHRRPGLCPANSGGDGGLVHPAVRTLRTGQRVVEQQPRVLEVGTDLQGSDDDRRGHRPPDPPCRDRRAEHPQLSSRGSSAEPEASHRCGGLQTRRRRLTIAEFPSAHLIVAKGQN